MSHRQPHVTVQPPTSSPSSPSSSSSSQPSKSPQPDHVSHRDSPSPSSLPPSPSSAMALPSPPPPTVKQLSERPGADGVTGELSRLQRYALEAPEWQFNAVAGAIGGFTSGVVTCPLDVIKTKLQAQGGFRHLDRGRHAGHPNIYNGLTGTARVIWRNEGIRGLYRGLGPIVLGYLPTWSVYFTVYHRSKSIFNQYTENSNLVNVYSSVVAGATSTIVTNPIWVIKTRLMSQSLHTVSLFPKSANTPTSRPVLHAPWHYRSTLDAARKMYTTEGILSFYSGLTPALLGLTHVAVHVPVYEILKTRFTGQPLGAGTSKLGAALSGGGNHKHDDDDDDDDDDRRRHGGLWHSHASQQHPQRTHWLGVLSASILSKILASSATYPHEVIRTRLQTQRRPVAGEAFLQGMGIGLPTSVEGDGKGRSESVAGGAKLKYRGVIKTFRTILAEEGWRAFYAGMGTNMMRAVPASTVTFLTYEYIMGRLNQARRDGERMVRGSGDLMSSGGWG